MANRREFIVAGGVGLASIGSRAQPVRGLKTPRAVSADLYELRRYVIDHEQQRQGFDAFARRPSPREPDRDLAGWSVLCREGTGSATCCCDIDPRIRC